MGFEDWRDMDLPPAPVLKVMVDSTRQWDLSTEEKFQELVQQDATFKKQKHGDKGGTGVSTLFCVLLFS
jgi:hypothetical protein